jgi:hypothetical protein
MTTTPSEREPSEASGSAKSHGRGNRHWALFAVIFAGIVVFLPALRTPFLLDDYLHASMVRQAYPAARGPFDLYNFIDDADRTILLDRGMLPWWSHAELRVRFFRPLSSALVWAEHQLVGERPLWLHAHSFAWWVAAVIAAHCLFRRRLSERATGFATAIFALAPCHTLPLGWLANREALIALALGTFGLLETERWKEGEGIRHAFIALVAFALAALGGEYALCLGGYALALSFAHERGRRRFKLGGFALFAAPAAVYLALRARLGYGATGSGFYVDPLRDPLLFVSEAPRRAMTLFIEAWLALDSDTVTSSTPMPVVVVVALGIVALLVFAWRRASVEMAREKRRCLAAMTFGSIAALVPVMAVLPSPRLLGASMLGVAALVGEIIDGAWFGPSSLARGRRTELSGLVALALAFAHLVHGPGTSWIVGRQFQRSATNFAVHVEALRKRIAHLGDAEVIVVRGAGGSFFMPFALDVAGALPARWRVLSHTGHVLAQRRGPNTLELVVPPDQSVFPSYGNLFRDQTSAIRVGDTFSVPGMKASVLEVGTSGPRKVRFDFDKPIGSPGQLWMTESREGFPEALPPPEGFGKPFDP